MSADTGSQAPGELGQILFIYCGGLSRSWQCLPPSRMQSTSTKFMNEWVFFAAMSSQSMDLLFPTMLFFFNVYLLLLSACFPGGKKLESPFPNSKINKTPLYLGYFCNCLHLKINLEENAIFTVVCLNRVRNPHSSFPSSRFSYGSQCGFLLVFKMISRYFVGYFVLLLWMGSFCYYVFFLGILGMQENFRCWFCPHAWVTSLRTRASLSCTWACEGCGW